MCVSPVPGEAGAPSGISTLSTEVQWGRRRELWTVWLPGWTGHMVAENRDAKYAGGVTELEKGCPVEVTPDMGRREGVGRGRGNGRAVGQTPRSGAPGRG